jgi:hypothetical protein
VLLLRRALQLPRVPLLLLLQQVTVMGTCWLAWSMTTACPTHLGSVLVPQHTRPQALLLLLLLPPQLTVKKTCWLACSMTPACQTHPVCRELQLQLLVLLLLPNATVMRICWLAWHMTPSCRPQKVCRVFVPKLPQALKPWLLPPPPPQQQQLQLQGMTVMKIYWLAWLTTAACTNHVHSWQQRQQQRQQQ